MRNARPRRCTTMTTGTSRCARDPNSSSSGTRLGAGRCLDHLKVAPVSVQLHAVSQKKATPFHPRQGGLAGPTTAKTSAAFTSRAPMGSRGPTV